MLLATIKDLSGKYLFFGKLIKSFEFEYKNNGISIVFCYNNTINSKGI